MKRMIPVIICVVVGLCLTGCSENMLEPKGPDDALLVGGITLEAKGYVETQNMYVDGEHSRNITITLRNLENEEEYNVKTISSGLFWSNKLPAGVYYIRGFSFTLERDNYVYTLNSRPSSPITLTIEPGKVTNLGVFLWYTDNKKDEHYHKQVKSPAELREELFALYPKSGWRQRGWLSI